MANMNISLPDEMKRYIESQVRNGQFHNSSEFIRNAIRSYQKNMELERLESMIAEGVASGESRALTKSVWDEIRDRARSSQKAK